MNDDEHSLFMALMLNTIFYAGDIRVNLR